MSARKIVYAPAKVNFSLHVLGKRTDGYHDLAMLMQRIALFDRLEVKLIEGTEIKVFCPGLELDDGEENIVVKSAKLLLNHVGLKQGVSIVVEKKIPAAAGLGGGSSNAAAVLEAINALLGLDLPSAELMALGSRLGADVPFFLYKKTAWATGVGDRFEAWPGMPPVTLVLVNPGIAVSTASIFRTLGLTHPRPIARIPRFPEGMSGLVRLLHNDLEAVACQRHPVITTIKERLVASGAGGALMSGSGATVFGLFDCRESAEQAAQNLSGQSDWWVEIVDLL